MAQYQDKKGFWYVQCRNPLNGKSTTIRKNPKTEEHFQTKREAKIFEAEYLKNKYNLSMNFEQLYEEYRKSFLLKNPTDFDLHSWYKNHLCRFAKRKVNTIKPADLSNLQLDMKKKGYSINYINKMTSLCNTILNFGVAQGYLTQNPCSRIKPLKNIKVDEETLYWTVDQFSTVIASIPHVFSDSADIRLIRNVLVFAYLTGLRVGEVRALKWRKVDFKKNRIIIDHHIAKHNIIKNGRKNNNQLILYMDNNTKVLLQEMYAYASKIEGFTQDSYVFYSTREGMSIPVGSNTPNRWVKKLAEYNDLPHIHFHGLRHSCASYLISIVGLNPYEVADRLGDTVEVVLEVYASFFNESKLTAASKINNFEADFQSLIGKGGSSDD